MSDDMSGRPSTANRPTTELRPRAGLAERLVRAEEKRRRAERDLAQLRARARAAERARVERARYLIGALVLEEAASNSRIAAWLSSRLDGLSAHERAVVETALGDLGGPA